MKAQNTLTLSNLIFLLLFAISLFIGGIWRSVFHLLAFLVAILFGVWCAPDEVDKLSALRLLTARDTTLALPLIPPTVALTMLTAIGFSALFSFFDIESGATLTGSFFAALLEHALLPAVCEELLFRYLPIVLLGRDNPKGLILTSAFFFALGHVSIPHLPYAFLAGICYMALALMTDSVWPCVLTHFVNNLLSLSLTFFPATTAPILIIFAAVTLLCVIFLVIKRRVYLDRIRPLLVGKSHEFLTRTPILYAVLVLLLCATVI